MRLTIYYFANSLFPCAELSLTVPIVNTLAFLFTVIGEWWVEKKVISRGETPMSTNPQHIRLPPRVLLLT